MSESETPDTEVRTPVPEGYAPLSELAGAGSQRVVLCRGSGGAEVVVRMLGAGGLDPARSADLAIELNALASATQHPCAVPMTRVWVDPGVGVCVEQPFMSGGSMALAEVLEPTELAVGGVRLAAALSAAHGAGVLHGDVRPSNVLLDGEGNWLLADCGLRDARQRADPDRAMPRVARFAPRELLGWEQPAPSADVYGLGATLCAIAGAEDPARLQGMPPELSSLLIRMLASSPADRPALTEVDQVLRALVPQAARDRLPDPPRPRASVPAPRPRVRIAVPQPEVIARAGRRRTVLAAGTIAATFVVGATAVAVANTKRDDPAVAVAQVAPAPTPSLQPSPQPAGAAPATGTLTPGPVTVGPDPDFVDRLRVVFAMQSITPEVRGWVITAVHPTTGAVVLQDFYPIGKTGIGPRAYRFVPRVPFASCVTVETDAGRRRYPSARVCPDPKVARAAEAARAKAAKEAAEQEKPAAPPAKKDRKT